MLGSIGVFEFVPEYAIDVYGDIWMGLENGEGTIDIVNFDLKRDAGIETAVLISLFTDQRVEDIDLHPDNARNKRGWWGNAFNEVEIGSKLWLLFREKNTPDVLDKIKEKALQSLQWLIDDGAVKEINLSLERLDTYTVLMIIDIIEPDGTQKFYKYAYNWIAEELKRGV